MCVVYIYIGVWEYLNTHMHTEAEEHIGCSVLWLSFFWRSLSLNLELCWWAASSSNAPVFTPLIITRKTSAWGHVHSFNGDCGNFKTDPHTWAEHLMLSHLYGPVLIIFITHVNFASSIKVSNLLKTMFYMF